MTVTDVIAALKRMRTMQGETLPPSGPMREMWQAERATMEKLEAQLLERLNAQREVRA